MNSKKLRLGGSSQDRDTPRSSDRWQSAKRLLNIGLTVPRLSLYLGVVSMVLAALLDGAGIGLTIPFLRLLLNEGISFSLPGVPLAQAANLWLTQQPKSMLIGLFALILLGSLALKSLFSYLAQVMTTMYREEVVGLFRKRLYEKYIYAPVTFFDNEKLGTLSSTLTEVISINIMLAFSVSLLTSIFILTAYLCTMVLVYTLKVWNLETGEELFTLNGHNRSVNAIAVTPNGKQVISGSNDNTFKVWNLGTGEELFTLNGRHNGRVYAITVSPDGRQVISGSLDNTLKVWNLETGEELFTLNGHNRSVNAIAVTPNGKQVISGSDDKTLKVWNLETGEELFTLNGHNASVRAVAVSPNGKEVISGSDDKTLKVWNLETGEELFTVNGHNASVRAVAITPNGKQVISGSFDNTLKVWNLETEEVVTTFTGDGSIYCCAVAPDGVTIVAGEASGRLHFLRLEGVDG